MTTWRNGLLFGAVALSLSGWLWMAMSVRAYVRPQLGLLAVVFALLMAGVHWHYRNRLTANLITANLALGLVVHTTLAALIVMIDRLMILGLAPAMGRNGFHFVIGALGIVGAFVSWTKSRGSGEDLTPTVKAEPEPPPPDLAELSQATDWTEVQEELITEPERLRAVQALQRVEGALEESPEAARRVIRQEVMRLQAEADAERRTADDDDVLSQVASFLEWGAQKLPELSEMDLSDLIMGKAIADIRAASTGVERIFVDHRKLLPIHPITRATADDKVNARADAARAALPLLRANGMRFSEDLIAAHDELATFKSVTGFQVVELPDGRYVTFEGNGRREALLRAFGEEGVEVEVRRFDFADATALASMQAKVERVRRWKDVAD